MTSSSVPLLENGGTRASAVKWKGTPEHEIWVTASFMTICNSLIYWNFTCRICKIWKRSSTHLHLSSNTPCCDGNKTIDESSCESWGLQYRGVKFCDERMFTFRSHTNWIWLYPRGFMFVPTWYFQWEAIFPYHLSSKNKDHNSICLI